MTRSINVVMSQYREKTKEYKHDTIHLFIKVHVLLNFDFNGLIIACFFFSFLHCLSQLI